MEQKDQLPDISMDATSLYREEVYTDQQVGSVRVMTPVKTDGSTDMSRSVLYYGSASLMTPAGAIPLNFELEGASLEEAISNFGDAAQKAFEETVEELKELRRQAASSIVVPGAGGGQGGMPGGGSGGPGGMPGGGMPGGGIKMP